MIFRVRELKLPLDHSKKQIWEAAARRLGIKAKDIIAITLMRKAIDARKKKLFFTYTVDVEVDDKIRIPDKGSSSPVQKRPENTLKPQPGTARLPYSPLIIGTGPAGLFCALHLARNGYKPVLVEQGQDIDRRVKAVKKFWRQGKLNPRSNTQFGEGGAGSFSDGKLTTRIDDERIAYVLQTFADFGADEEIKYVKKPHVGTDVIRKIVKKIRQEILSLGGEYHFDCCLTDMNINNSHLNSIIINNENEIPCSVVVLAVGNSARQVYRMLHRKGVAMMPKAFAVGVRVEHPQSLIDRIQFGEYAGHPRLGAADYHLTYQDEGGRSFYTFCMCPGGYVIGASSEAGQVVTNGMSYRARNSGVANSALVVTVKPSDWDNQVLGGLEYQEQLEKQAFILGGGNYHAPAQLLTDFLNQVPTSTLEGSLATYTPGVTPANLWQLFPQDICQVMQQGIAVWDKKLHGFAGDSAGAVLTGVETRTSAPLRILRGEDLSSLNVDNLYPCGEGAGYAGGIVSSAIDGLKIAEKIMATFAKPEKTVSVSQGTVL